jgi:hypothetical protein
MRRSGIREGVVISFVTACTTVIPAKAGIQLLSKKLDRPVIGERSDAVLRTAMPGDDSGVCLAWGVRS